MTHPAVQAAPAMSECIRRAEERRATGQPLVVTVAECEAQTIEDIKDELRWKRLESGEYAFDPVVVVDGGGVLRFTVTAPSGDTIKLKARSTGEHLIEIDDN